MKSIKSNKSWSLITHFTPANKQILQVYGINNVMVTSINLAKPQM